MGPNPTHSSRRPCQRRMSSTCSYTFLGTKICTTHARSLAHRPCLGSAMEAQSGGSCLENVGSRGLAEWWMHGAANRRRRPLPARARCQPRGPVRPPAALVLLRAGEPLLGGLGLRVGIVRPITALAFGRRVDHAGDVAARRQYEAGFRASQSGDAPGPAPRHDRVLLWADGMNLSGDARYVDRPAEQGDLGGLDENGLEIGV